MNDDRFFIFNRRKLPLSKMVELTSLNPAMLFGLYPQKGTFEPGSDTDFVIVDLESEWVFKQDDIKSYYPLNPYVGMKFKGSVISTYLRGNCAFSQGDILADPGYGKLVLPERKLSK